MRRGNLFGGLPGPQPDELVEGLLEHAGLRLERTVSTGHATPPDRWYDQEHIEWVVVLRGQATLCFEGDPEPLTMQPGDWIEIPAHRRHRVEWTDPAGPTVWLALHLCPTA